ncbi:MAG TPA: metallophosphoesterase family protein [Gaiellaceae bacterium]|nr:metallophosphoesterase family protein [Gaiellaceae bacterium]
MLGILYDVHGNLDALNAVLGEAEAEGVDEWLLGGDYCAFGPWPVGTLERLRRLQNATWLRGNGERWLVDPPMDMPAEQSDFVFAALASAIAQLGAGDIDYLVGLPTLAEREEAFYCHGSPLSDVDSFAPESGEEDVRLLAGIEETQVVFGHSHVQFRREGANDTDLVNPGSVGMPIDGDTRAAWAIRRDDGSIELRRTAYDTAPAIAKMREYDWGERVALRLLNGRD